MCALVNIILLEVYLLSCHDLIHFHSHHCFISSMADSSSDSETELSIPSMMELFGRSPHSHLPTSLVPTINPDLLMLHSLSLALQSLRDLLVDIPVSIFPGSDAYKMFLPSKSEHEPESVTLGKNLEKWSKIQHPEGKGKFFQSFMSEVNQFLNNDLQKKYRKPKSVPFHQPTALPSESVMQFLLKFVANDPSMLSLAKHVSNLLTSVFQEAHNLHSVAYLPHQYGEESTHVSVTDFSAVSDKSLSRVMSLFSPQNQSQSRESLLESLSKYVPKREHKANHLTSSVDLLHTDAVNMQCTKCHTTLKRSNTCSECSKPFLQSVSKQERESSKTRKHENSANMLRLPC